MHLDTMQQEVAAALKDNSALLAEVGPSGGLWGAPYSAPPLPSCPTHPPPPPQVQKTMKENLAVVEDNFAEVEARIKRLQK